MMNNVTREHVFSHLGPAPYRYTGCTENRFVVSGFGSKPGGCCDHCGTGILYEFHFEAANGRTFKVGSSCVTKSGDAGLRRVIDADVKAQQKAVRLARQTAKVAAARDAFLSTRPELVSAIEQAKQPIHANNYYAQGIIANLNRYGSIWDSQVANLLRSLAADVTKAAEKAAQAVEVKGAAPVGRVTVTGTVVGLKHHESSFGHFGVESVLKMTVKLANNACVWMTVPSGQKVERGQTVTVTATFTVSDRDASFAFGKRPAGLVVA